MTQRASVIIPTRDRPEMLRRAVMSALKAARSDDQVIVVDDRSKITAQDCLSDIQDPRLHIILCRGEGAAAARNTGVEDATGELIFFLDDDDEMLSHYILHVVNEVCIKTPSPVFGYAAFFLADERKGKGNRKLRSPKRAGYLDRSRPFERRSHGFGMGFWIRRHVFDAIGPIATDLPTNEDTEYFLRLMLSPHVGWFSQKPGMQVNKHDHRLGELSHLTDRTTVKVRANAIRKILERHAGGLEAHPSAHHFLKRKLVRLMAKSGDFELGRRLAATQGSMLSRWSLWGYALFYWLKAGKRV